MGHSCQCYCVRIVPIVPSTHPPFSVPHANTSRIHFSSAVLLVDTSFTGWAFLWMPLLAGRFGYFRAIPPFCSGHKHRGRLEDSSPERWLRPPHPSFSYASDSSLLFAAKWVSFHFGEAAVSAAFGLRHFQEQMLGQLLYL